MGQGEGEQREGRQAGRQGDVAVPDRGGLLRDPLTARPRGDGTETAARLRYTSAMLSAALQEIVDAVTSPPSYRLTLDALAEGLAPGSVAFAEVKEFTAARGAAGLSLQRAAPASCGSADLAAALTA